MTTQIERLEVGDRRLEANGAVANGAETNSTVRKSQFSTTRESPDPASTDTVSALRDQIRRMQHAQRAADPTLISSGLEAIDRMLPDGGYLPGSLVEFVSEYDGDAARWMSLHLAGRALSSRGGSLVLVDAQRELYAPGLASLGIPLEQTVIVHGNSSEDLYWAIDQSLRCEAVAAVWGLVPTTDSRWLRRFQLSAESSGTLGIFLRPASVLPHPTWSEIQWRSMGPRPVHENNSSMGPRPVHKNTKKQNHARAGDPCYADKEASQVHGSELPRNDWQFRLRLVRARTGVGNEIGLAIDANSGQLKTVAPVKTHRGPIAPPPDATRSMGPRPVHENKSSMGPRPVHENTSSMGPRPVHNDTKKQNHARAGDPCYATKRRPGAVA